MKDRAGSLGPDRVNFVDKDDARSASLGSPEQIANSSCTLKLKKLGQDSFLWLFFGLDVNHILKPALKHKYTFYGKDCYS
jgi:hypothetical protein